MSLHGNLNFVSVDVPTGELPRNVVLSLDRRLVETIVPGIRLTVVGIYSVYQTSAKYVQPTLSVSSVILVDKHILKMLICSFYSQKSAVGVKQPYIRVVELEQT
jgi:DNA replication licensing factor MCM5